VSELPFLDDSRMECDASPLPPRAAGEAILRGLRCRCPVCGVGSLFPRFLKLAPVCRHCGEELHHARPDDAPPYFVILIVGHLVVPLVLVVEEAFSPPTWITATVSAIIACGLALVLLQPIKGAIVGLQWANRMHGFDARTRSEVPSPHKDDRLSTA
jgi:uncharacterized protein (DUF983 family)